MARPQPTRHATRSKAPDRGSNRAAPGTYQRKENHDSHGRAGCPHPANNMSPTAMATNHRSEASIARDNPRRIVASQPRRGCGSGPMRRTRRALSAPGSGRGWADRPADGAWREVQRETGCLSFERRRLTAGRSWPACAVQTLDDTNRRSRLHDDIGLASRVSPRAPSADSQPVVIEPRGPPCRPHSETVAAGEYACATTKAGLDHGRDRGWVRLLHAYTGCAAPVTASRRQRARAGPFSWWRLSRGSGDERGMPPVPKAQALGAGVVAAPDREQLPRGSSGHVAGSEASGASLSPGRDRQRWHGPDVFHPGGRGDLALWDHVALPRRYR